jgi:hypothetical protein
VKQHIVVMLGGPGTLRFLLQPAVAVLLGVLHGIRDRHAGHPPFFIGVGRARGRRLVRLGDAVREMALPLTVAIIASLAFQFLIRAHVHVAYALLYAFLFVAVPYSVARGLANRVVRISFDGRRPAGRYVEGP